LPKAVVTANKEARQALATGEVASAEIQLKKEKDLRTLYVRFKVRNDRNLRLKIMYEQHNLFAEKATKGKARKYPVLVVPLISSIRLGHSVADVVNLFFVNLAIILLF
jgi:hypothetical protein